MGRGMQNLHFCINRCFLCILCSPGNVVFIERARIFDVDILPHVTLCCIQLL